jgi:peptidoglycan/LPS O-acetylase OafA/YrhL
MEISWAKHAFLYPVFLCFLFSSGQKTQTVFSIKNNLPINPIKELWFRPPLISKPIDGLRAISCLWLILFHCCWYLGFFLDKDSFSDLVSIPYLHWIWQGNLGVDLFFIISGYLISDHLIKEYLQNNSLNIRKFYAKRFLRIMPVYIAVLIIYGIVIKTNYSEVWTNLLYINNYVPYEKQYMPWTWSLAVEMQFYILIPFFLTACLSLRKNHVLLLLISIIVIGVFINVLLAMENNLFSIPPIHPTLGSIEFYSYIDTLYTPSHTRYGSLLMGTLTAYISNNVNLAGLKKYQSTFSVLILILLLIIISIVFVSGTSTLKSKNMTIFLLSDYHYLFSASVILIVLIGFFFKNNLMKFLHHLLSLKIWSPFAKLSYSAYLLSPIIITIVYQKFLPINAKTGLYSFNLIGLILTIIFVTYTLSAFFYFLIEKPFITISKNKNKLDL